MWLAIISDNFVDTPLYCPHMFAAPSKAFAMQFSRGKLSTFSVLHRVSKSDCPEVEMTCFNAITRSQTSSCITYLSTIEHWSITGNNREAAVIAQTLVCAHTSPNKRVRTYNIVIVIPAKTSLGDQNDGGGGSPLCALHRLRYHYNFRYHYHHHHHYIITPSGGDGGRLITGTICRPNVCHRGWLHSRAAFQSIQTIDEKDEYEEEYSYTGR